MVKNILTITHPKFLTWVVSLLGGAEKRVDTEDIAVRAFQLAPQRFGWRKYPQHINLELIRVYLSDAKKREHGQLLAGSGKTGWSLTRKGLDWLEVAQPRLLSLDLSGAPSRARRAGSIDTNRRDREQRRIMSLAAWQRWSAGDKTVVPSEVREVFRIDSYATATVREAKMTRLRAMFANDEELCGFLAHLGHELDKDGGLDG